MTQQLEFFNANLNATSPKKQIQKENWFADALKTLKVKQGPGWPDEFGLAIENWISNSRNTPVRTLSLFSGGGGLDIGFHDVGFHVVEMVEIEEKFCESLRANSNLNGYFSNSPNVICTDIRKYNGDLKNIDFIIGGPPCQTFSAAGRRAAGVQGIDDPRGTLFEEYVRLLKKLKPKGFLFENVYGIIGAQGGKAWELIVNSFKEIGYNLSYRILDTADFGVPQHRERLIIVGLKDGTFKFPRPTHGPDSSDSSDYYTAGLAVAGLTNPSEKELGGRFGHLLEKIPPGLNYSFFTSEMGHPNPVFAWRSKFSDFLYKADPKRPVRTIKAQGGQYTGPFSWNNRKFSVDEHKRLQTFPDSYILKGGKQIAVKQIGNSVPPQFARILGLAIFEQVFGAKLPFQIDYLNANEELGFRQRKRSLTKIYQEAANNEIIKLGKDISQITQKKKMKGNSFRFFSPNSFSWASEKTTEFDLEYSIRHSSTKDKISLTVNKGSPPTDKPEIEIKFLPKSNKAILDKPLIVSIGDSSDSSINAGFRAAEEYIKEHFGMADLVQLSGYYQYEPKILISLNAVNVRSSETRELIDFINALIDQGMVAKQLHINDISKASNRSKKEILKLLHRMKNMGFEVRSSKTNPQIPDESFIVPYAFPSLTPLSVQLRKGL